MDMKYEWAYDNYEVLMYSQAVVICMFFARSTNPHAPTTAPQHAKLLYSGQTGHEMTEFPPYEVCECIGKIIVAQCSSLAPFCTPDRCVVCEG